MRSLQVLDKRSCCNLLPAADEPLPPAGARRVEVGRLADDDCAVSCAVLGVIERGEVVDDLRVPRAGQDTSAQKGERKQAKRTGLLQIATSYLPQRYLTWFSWFSACTRKR